MDVKINTQNVAIVSDDHLKQQYQKVTLLNILNFIKFIFSENFTILHKFLYSIISIETLLIANICPQICFKKDLNKKREEIRVICCTLDKIFLSDN